MKTGTAALGILAGIAIGAIAGILLAPDKGSNTRKKLMSKGDDLANEIREKIDEVLGNVNEKYERVREEAENLAEKGKAKYASMGKDHSSNTKDATNA